VKFTYLDGLRGVAAFVVLLDHFAFIFFPFAITGTGVMRWGTDWVHNTPLYLLVDGDFAVSIFFVLSAIVLSAKFFATGRDSVVVATAVKRYFRLALPVVGSVLVACGLVALGLMHNQPAAAITGSGWWAGFWTFPANVARAAYEGAVGVFVSNSYTYNPPLWTIQMEFMGSFLVFLVLLLFGKLRNRWVLYVVLAAAFSKTYYLAFVLGVMICDYYFNQPQGSLRKLLERGYWLPVLVLALVLGSYPVGAVDGTLFAHWHLPGYSLVMLCHIAGAAGLIAAIMSAPPLQRWLVVRPVQFLGRISFSLYLLHFLVLGAYSSYLLSVLPAELPYWWRAVVVLVPTVILTVAVSYIYTRWVDEPAIRFSGWLYRRMFGPVLASEPEREPEPVRPGKPAGAVESWYNG
jgi:peptidoglycan/LPS O-acetylase OafA/YrhL